jgi:sugar/nucleoside kinase (ribokinase family)
MPRCRGAPDLVKINADEAAEVTGADAPDAAVTALRRRLLDAGVAAPVVIVTLGERGALLCDDAGPPHGDLDTRGP